MSTETKTVGYCRACGKGLDETTVRTAHGTIYCEEHLPVEGTTANPSATASPYTASPYTATAPPPIPNTHVSPGLAFLLGMIPGVGAIYNGQYAKGLIHVIIVGLMISILDSGSAAGGLEPLVGMMLAGFWFYMAFEAYHTARRRQFGQSVDEFSSLIPMRGSNKFPAAPIVLIALGIIFLLNNLDLLDLRHALRYWPVALIAVGAYMLYLRMGGSHEGDTR